MDSHSLGLYLREAREARELTLDHAVQTLKIRRGILEAFERGEFNTLSISVVQLRGFLRNYADYLGLDPDLVIQYYESSQSTGRNRKRRQERKEPTESRKRRRITQETAALQQERPDTETNPTHPDRPPTGERRSDRLNERRERRRRRRSSLLNALLIVLVSLIAITVITVVILDFLEEPTNDIIPEAASQATPTDIPTFAPVATRPPLATALPEFQQDFDGRGIVITIETTQRTWMQVTVDGIEQLARLIVPGEIFNYRADTEVTVTASNAMGLLVIYNGQPQPIFGERGQEVQLQFTPAEMNVIVSEIPAADTNSDAANSAQAAPSTTPTPSPIATDTPLPSPTPLITSANTETTETPTIPAVASPTPLLTSPPITPTLTPTSTADPAATATSDTTSTTATLEPTATTPAQPTAILPPRVTPANPTPVKPLP